MPTDNLSIVAHELNIDIKQVQATFQLLTDGATVPFIARYRKEATGSLDEVAIAKIRDRMEELDAFDKRRSAIIKSLDERNLLTDDLRRGITKATTLNELED